MFFQQARRTGEQKKESVGQQSEIFQQFSDDFVSSESKSNLRVFTGPPVETTTTKKVEDFLPEEVEEATTDNYDYEYYDHDNTKLHSERVPKLISNNKGSDVQLIPDSQEKTLKPGGNIINIL